jgi:CheY-like chemotaxis protein
MQDVALEHSIVYSNHMKAMIDCGNCVPDFTAIESMIHRHFPTVNVLRTHGIDDTLALLRTQPIALITVNRKLDADYSDGLDVIKALKADPDFAHIPVMLVSNYPEAQAEAMAAGAVQGFGKLALWDDALRTLLAEYLG